MEKARPGVPVTHETRGLANECAYKLYRKKDRQLTAPRLTELTAKGFVEPIGTKTDTVTHRPVAVYSIREA